MKNITITPHAIISLLLCSALLVNTSAPALAQIKSTKLQESHLSRQVQLAIERDTQMATEKDTQLEQQIRFFKTTEKLSNGKLTPAQLTRLTQIKMMFTPTGTETKTQSDFEQFQSLYNTQIEKEFTREQTAMKESVVLMDEKIKLQQANYHKEIHTALTTNYIMDQVLYNSHLSEPQQKEIAHRISKELQQLPYDPDLNTQVTELAQKYKNDPASFQILTGIAKYTHLREQALAQWKEQANTKLTSWYKENATLLSNWKKQALVNAQQVFDKEYEPKLLQGREQQVQLAVRDLWTYKDLAPKAAQILLRLAPIILQLRTMEGEPFFNKDQKEWLYRQYMHDIQAGLTCENSDESDACDTALLAITGLSMLTDDRPTASAIEELMEAKLKTAYGVPTLLAGTAALLSMKQYGVLNGFLHTATFNEYNVENFDILSIENLVNMAANRHGHYLGEVSKYAQYPLQANPTEHTPLANAWEDIAQLLAADGSTEALALLRQYGVEQCYAFTEQSITLQEKQQLACRGIMPFLVGALMSGKSGADKYNPAGVQTQAGTYLTSQGTSIYVSPEKAQQNDRTQKAFIQEFYNHAASMGLSQAAMVARHIFLQTMGDLNPESELRVDTQLYEAYQASHPQPKPGFEIKAYTRNSPTYNAKRIRHERNQILRKIAHWGDIAILVWCVYDLSKWLRNGVKISRALIKSANMARNGATVAQRAAMLHRLNIAPELRSFINLGSKIKGNLAPTVLAQMPHFTSSTVELPKIEGFIESTSKLVAQNLRFDAKKGLLAANIPAITQTAQGVYTAEQLNPVNDFFKLASFNTNIQFVDRSIWKRVFTFNKDAAYRSYLARNLLKFTPPEIFETADLHNLALQVAHSASIKVPQDISLFKIPSFLEKVDGVSQLNMSFLTKLMARIFGATPTTEQITHTEGLLNSALVNANAEFLNRGWLSRKLNWRHGTNNQTYRNILSDNIIAEFDRDGTIFKDPKFFKLHQQIIQWVAEDKTITAPAWATRFKFFDTVSHGGEFHTMGAALLAPEKDAVPLKLPLEVQIQLKKPFRGIEGYQRILISKNAKNEDLLLFGFGNNLNSPINPSQFKLKVEMQDIPALLRAAQTYTGKVLELKLDAPKNSYWRSFFNSFRDKKNIYVHEIPVRLRQADGSLFTLPIKFKAESSLGLNGVTAVLEEGNTLAWYRGRNLLKAPELTFGLPKNQLRPFVGVLAQSQLKNPLRLKALAGKNKIRPLYFATGLSLSSASAGLITPLESVYGDRITESERNWISLVFPYAPSLFVPFFSGIVLKVGALRTLQTALAASTAGLTVAALNGFYWHVNPSNLPPLWPLYVSGLAIGLSSALSRSGLNLLIDSMGGGGSLLQSMAWKNAGSFLLLLPPIVFNAFSPKVDFSSSFPTLAVLSFASLAYVSSARISTELGKMPKLINPNFMPFITNWKKPLTLHKTLWQDTKTLGSAIWNEAKTTTGLLGTKQVLPLVLAATAFTAFESSAFTKAGNSLIGSHLKNANLPFLPSSNRQNFINLLTNISVISAPFIMRYYSKPVLHLLETAHAGDEYRRMLKISFALNAAGAGLLYTNGFDGYFSPGMLGILLMGLGTAQMTQSFQKLSNTSVINSTYAQKILKGFPGAPKAVENFLVSETMTGFPIQQLGIAILPTIVGRYTDNQIKNGLTEKRDATLSSLWMPFSALALCFGFAAKQIGWFPERLSTGLAGLTKGIVGSYPGAFKQLPKVDFYMKKPSFGTPYNFTPMYNNPILNVKDIIPSQNELKNIEKELQSPAVQPTEKNSQPSVEETEDEPATTLQTRSL